MEPIQDDIETLAAEFHAIYQAEAKRQGDVRHHDDYDALPENIKEFDRVLARHVIGLVAERDRLIAENKRFIELTDNIQAENDRLIQANNKLRGAASLLAGWQKPPCDSPEAGEAFMLMVVQARERIAESEALTKTTEAL